MPDTGSPSTRIRSASRPSQIAVWRSSWWRQRDGVCVRPPCVTVFADTSRNGRREYCSARCGNHDAVHRRRARNRAGG
ncbi:CGNR zinc finger domain-containing protein [Dactylosporangium sp. NPDC000521]|uniref:CGNR zinc finger domain-containing protein n=1 Tax=Dactylosporangium sp. NPDC000521 TaxID=3363975 RepID=UPI0036C5BC9E